MTIEPFPDRKYDVIYADCPWTYCDKAKSGKRGVEFRYSTMTIDEIQALPVADITNKNAVLFLWVTWPLLQEGLDTMRAWGFKYRTVGFVWIKLNRLLTAIVGRVLLGSLFGKSNFISSLLEKIVFLGMGNWTRTNSEVCLMGVRGRPKRKGKNVRSVILSPIREHSQKPDEARDRIVQLMGDVPRIELFARMRTPGWDVWGDDTERYGGDTPCHTS